MRARTAISLACVLALAAAACGSQAESGRVTRAPADLTNGFAEVVVPLPTRQSPMVVAAGDHVVVFGGYRFAGNTQTPRGDGADYDIAKGEWMAMSPAPFDRPLYQAAGVWTGREVIVIGTPCGATTTEMELARCAHATVAAAAYSPSRHSWRALRSPPRSRFPWVAKGAPLGAGGLGWAGNAAVFEIYDGEPYRQNLLLDPEAETWTFAPPLKFASTFSVTGGHLVAGVIGETAPNVGFGTATPGSPLPPVRAITLSNDHRRWTESASASRGGPTPMFDRVYRAPGVLMYASILPPPTGFDAGGLWYEPDARRWAELPSFAAAGFPGEMSPAELDGTRLVWLGGTVGLDAIERSGPTSQPQVQTSRRVSTPATDGQLFVLPRGSTAWLRPKPPIAGPVSISALDQLLLVIPSGRLGAKRMKIGLLDLNRLPRPEK